jgi:hypothetical protein
MDLVGFTAGATILSVTLLGNGDLAVVEQTPMSYGTTLLYCGDRRPDCNDHPPVVIKHIYRAGKDGKIYLYKDVQQVPVTKTKEVTEMEFPE